MEKLRIAGAAILEKSEWFITLDQVVQITGLGRIEIRRILEKLKREGLVIKVSQKPGYLKIDNPTPWPEKKGRPPLAITYRVASKEKLMERVAPKQREGTGQERMWFVIRKKGLFTMRDLIILAEVKRESARWYVKQLRRLGIVRPNKAGGPGVEWTLIKDIGPKRPSVGTKGLRTVD